MFNGNKSKGTNPPSGMKMMLDALGIKFDPLMFQAMADAVEEIRARLQRIEENGQRVEKDLALVIALLKGGSYARELTVSSSNSGGGSNSGSDSETGRD